MESNLDDYKVFENRTVDVGVPQPWKISAQYNKQEIPDRYLKVMEDYGTVAFLVIVNGQIINEKYWEGYSASSLSGSFSMAKSIVSLLVGIALDEGKIKSVDQLVGDYIPEFRLGNRSKLTIKHLLTNNSGIEWDESYSTLFSITTKAYYGSDLDSLVKSLEVIQAPGNKLVYQSCNAQILGEILEAATGVKLSTYASEKLWKPLGAEHAALWSLDRKDGMEKAFCCFNSNARDFARLGQLVLNGGLWGQTRIISEQYLKEATAPSLWLVDEQNKPVDYYGYQFWIMRHRDLVISYLRGIHGQYVFIIPQKNAVVVRLGEKRSDVEKNHTRLDAFEYIDAALEVMK
jgi:CubicO group peptidase (beta-lactamase class C family)